MDQPTGDWANTVVHLLALARRLEEHGQINVAKLARAAADSMTRRAAYALDLPEDANTLAAILNDLIPTLPGFGLSDELTRTMAHGVAIMSAGRLPLYDDAPAPFVCRACGEVTMQPPQSPCPTCGAWPATFERYQPVYWLDALRPAEALAQLRDTPAVVAGLLAGLAEEQMARPPAGGGWSLRQVVAHLRDAEGVLRFRLQRMVEEENPLLESQAVFAWATSEEDRPPTMAEIMDAYRRSRDESLAILAALPGMDWQRPGRHTEFGQVTILQQASYFAAHEQTHLATLADLRVSLSR